MQRNFPESDWKILSHLKPLALDRLCRRILQESSDISARGKDGEHHRAYLDLYRHIQESDKVMSDCFDTWSRSHAVDNLIHWRYQKLVADEEFAAFSSDTRAIVNGFLTRR